MAEDHLDTGVEGIPPGPFFSEVQGLWVSQHFLHVTVELDPDDPLLIVSSMPC